MDKRRILALVARLVRKNRLLVRTINAVAREASPESVVVLDYPLSSRQRWSEKNPHQKLYDIIDGNSTTYQQHLRSFLQFIDYFIKIPARRTHETLPAEPCWINGWMPTLDGVALYSFIAINKPKHYMEVGSGNSTKFARKAISDHGLGTKITSIDPSPRSEVDGICDEVIREPVENVSMQVFDRLGKNDILYVDNSHRVFMNSDATTVFLDVIPRLKPGVLVEIHDVTLPHDYPADWVHRHYSEQYLLAAYLLAGGNTFDIELPNAFITAHTEMRSILTPLWEKKEMEGVKKSGAAFWMRMK